jgi:hypothetical protein
MENYNQRRLTLLQNAQKLLSALTTFRQNNQDLSEAHLSTLSNYQTDLTGLIPRLQLRRIGITGMVSTGKSRLLNTLLGTTFPGEITGLLRTGEGSTTAVPFEIQRSSDGIYRAEVQFISVDDVKGFLRELSRIYASNDQAQNKSRDAIRLRLRGIFTRNSVPLDDTNLNDLEFAPPSEHQVLAYFNGNLETRAPYEYIGKSSERFSADNAQNLSEMLAPFTRNTRDIPTYPFLAAVVSRVILTIPSDNLPPGITLVDTPGLGDAIAMNVARTEALNHTLNEYWYLTQHAQSLSLEIEHQAVQNLICHGRTLCMVVTRCGNENPSRDEEPIRQQLSIIFAGRDPENMTPQEEEHFNEMRPLINERINQIKIVFTEVSQNQRVGIDVLEGWLQEAFQTQLTNLIDGENLFQRILASIRNTGIRQCQFGMNDLDNWNGSFQNGLQQIQLNLNYINNPSSYANAIYRGNWNGHQSSIKAALRRFGGPHYASNGTVFDLNRDIACEWNYQSSPIRSHITNLFQTKYQEMNQMRDALSHEPEAIQALDASLMNISRFHNLIMTDCFDGNVYEMVRQLSCTLGVYPYGKQHQGPKKIVNYHPYDDFNTIFQSFVQNIANRLREAMQAINEVHHRFYTLVQGVIAFPGAEALIQLLEVINLPDDLDLICPISHELFLEPTQVFPCGHIFNRLAIENWRNLRNNCPLCRGVINSLMRRYDIAAMVLLNQPPQGQEENWIVGLWPRIVAEETNLPQAQN